AKAFGMVPRIPERKPISCNTRREIIRKAVPRPILCPEQLRLQLYVQEMVFQADPCRGIVLSSDVGDHDTIAPAVGSSGIELNGVLHGENGKGYFRRLTIDLSQSVSFFKKIILLLISCLFS